MSLFVVPAKAGTSLSEVNIHDFTGMTEQIDDTPWKPFQNSIPLDRGETSAFDGKVRIKASENVV